MDMLVADLALKDETAAVKKKSKPVDTEEEPGFHFIAFIPSNGRVWKVDGYEPQPQHLGESSPSVSLRT